MRQILRSIFTKDGYILDGMASKGTRVVGGTIILGGLIASIVFQQRTVSRLREENERLARELATVRQASPPVPESAIDTNQLVELRNQERELIRLRGEVTTLRRERQVLSNELAAARNATGSKSASAPRVDKAWVEQMLNAPLNQQGLAAGTVRGKLLRGEDGVSASEIALSDALVQQRLNQTLERKPMQFADFQTAFIQGAVGISDTVKLQQIHDLIRRTYEQAVAEGLDIPSKPATDADAWVQRRFQLDRRATGAMEQILTPEEWRAFGRAFIGVMGVDLGNGGVDKSNYPKGFLGPE